MFKEIIYHHISFRIFLRITGINFKDINVLVYYTCMTGGLWQTDTHTKQHKLGQHSITFCAHNTLNSLIFWVLLCLVMFSGLSDKLKMQLSDISYIHIACCAYYSVAHNMSIVIIQISLYGIISDWWCFYEHYIHTYLG